MRSASSGSETGGGTFPTSRATSTSSGIDGEGGGAGRDGAKSRARRRSRAARRAGTVSREIIPPPPAPARSRGLRPGGRRQLPGALQFPYQWLDDEARFAGGVVL